MKWKRSKKNFPSTVKSSDNQSDASVNQDEACLDNQSEADVANLDDDSDIDVSDDADVDLDHPDGKKDVSKNADGLTLDSLDNCVTQMDMSIRNYSMKDSLAGRCSHLSNFSVENKLLNSSSIS